MTSAQVQTWEQYGLTFTGSEHDFAAYHGNTRIASVWHSDIGEWAVATNNGPTYYKPSKLYAMALCAQLAGLPTD